MAIRLKHVNVLLSVAAAFLVILWISSNTTFIGAVSYAVDSSDFKCEFSTQESAGEITDVDLCCFQVQQLLTCKRIEGDVDYVCYNSEEGNKYYLSSKTFNYCVKEGYDVI